MRWFISLTCALLLLTGCANDPVQERARSVLSDHERLMAAVQQQDAHSYSAALNKLRPGVNSLIRELEKTDAKLAGEVRNPFLQLETESQREPYAWDALLREAVLLERAVKRAAGD